VDLRLPVGPGVARGHTVTVTVDGQPVVAFRGESVVAALLANGYHTTRVTPRGAPRGLFCGMGVCFDCLVTVNGIPNSRACVTWVRDGMVIERQVGFAAPSGSAAVPDFGNDVPASASGAGSGAEPPLDGRRHDARADNTNQYD
jgi:hypothetical protein